MFRNFEGICIHSLKQAGEYKLCNSWLNLNNKYMVTICSLNIYQIKTVEVLPVNVDSKFQSMQLDEVSTFNETISLKINTDKREIIIYCIYRSKNSNLNNDMKLYQTTGHESDKYNKTLIIIGDSIIHIIIGLTLVMKV